MTYELKATDDTLVRYWLWLSIAASFVVFVEPAASDLLISGLFVYAFARGLRLPVGLGLATLLLGIYLAGNVLASSLSPDPSVSVRPLMTRVYIAATWWLLITALIVESPKRNVRLVWNAFLFAGVAAALVGVLTAFGFFPDSEQLNDNGRIRAFFKDPNVFGPFLVPAAIFAVYELERVNRGRLWLYTGILFVTVLALMASFSRGALLNFSVSLTVFFTLRLLSERDNMRRRRTKLAIVALVASGTAAVVAGLSYEPVRNMLDRRAQLVQNYDVQSELGGRKSRIDAQIATAVLAMQKPLGIGSGQSMESYYQERAPHNLYLHVLVESGWVGGLAFYAFLTYALRRPGKLLFRRLAFRGEMHVAFSCVCGLLVQSLFIDSTHWRHFFLLLGILSALTLARERELVRARYGGDAHHAESHQLTRQVTS